jgi:tetratricopeptide (TPR) repeat protein
VRRSTTALTSIALLLLSTSLSSSAGEDKLSLRKAKALFSQGNTEYRLGNFAKALPLFQESLKLANRPNTIFNIAQCYRNLKDAEKALFNYRLYLSESERQSPDVAPPHQDEVQGHIAKLEAELQRVRQEQRLREESERKERERRAQQARTAEQQRARALVRATPPAPAPRPRPLYKKWWFWGSVAAVVVGGAVTAVALTTGGDARLAGGKDGRFDPATY